MRFLRSTSLTTRLLAAAAMVTLTVGAAATAFAVSGGIAGASPPAPPTPTPGTVELGSNHDGLAKATTREDADRVLATAEAEGRIRHMAGPATAGSVIEIAGRQVQLPADTYVRHRGISGECTDPQRCPARPVYQLVRGDSSIWVGSDGLMIDEVLVEGEHDAFDFLREALR